MKKPHVFKYQGDWYAEYRDFTSQTKRGFPYLKVYSAVGTSPVDAYQELMEVVRQRQLTSSPKGDGE